MLGRSRVRRAAIVLALVFAGLQTGTLAAQSAPSLDETLKWLHDYLPSATGATYLDTMAGLSMRTTTLFESIEGCSARMTFRSQLKNSNGTEDPPAEEVDEFDFSEINASTVTVKTDPSFQKVYEVTMETNKKARTIVRTGSPRGTEHLNQTGPFAFDDQASAQRAANALRHAAELCAKTQPF